jgi:hypothetical protein
MWCTAREQFLESDYSVTAQVQKPLLIFRWNGHVHAFQQAWTVFHATLKCFWVSAGNSLSSTVYQFLQALQVIQINSFRNSDRKKSGRVWYGLEIVVATGHTKQFLQQNTCACSVRRHPLTLKQNVSLANTDWFQTRFKSTKILLPACLPLYYLVLP